MLKRVHFIEDREGHRCELGYIRDKKGQEVDVVLLIDVEIQELIEGKFSEQIVTRSLRYYAERL